MDNRKSLSFIISPGYLQPRAVWIGIVGAIGFACAAGMPAPARLILE